MSAYALPGLFPPLESSCDYYSSSYYLNDGEKSADYPQSRLTAPATGSSPASIQVIIKDAKIDTAILIQSLLASNNNNHGKKDSGSYHSSAVQSRRRLVLRSTSRTNGQSSRDCLASPQEQAVQLELSVTWSGRSFVCQRNLARILQLYFDLKEERRDQIHSQGRDLSLESTMSSSNFKCLPSLPRLDEHDTLSKAGVVGRGFSLLQELLRSYVSVLEGWLQTAVAVVNPDESFVWKEFFLVETESSDGVDSMCRAVSNPAMNEKLVPIEESETEYDTECEQEDTL